ncbi:MAG: hypothetical protein ABSB24_01130 [Gaiellaceae bacterium]
MLEDLARSLLIAKRGVPERLEVHRPGVRRRCERLGWNERAEIGDGGEHEMGVAGVVEVVGELEQALGQFVKSPGECELVDPVELGS